MKQDAVLNIEGLTVRAASGDVLVRDVSLTLGAQECLGIAGESGSGKTVTAKSVLQLLPPDLRASARSLSVLGKDILSMTEPERRRFLGCEVGFVPQNTVAYLHPLIKVKRQLTDGYLCYHDTTKREALERAHELLEQVGIRDASRVMESYPGELSGGMRQRVNIAMALMSDPKLIIADEPTTALDCVVQQQVVELFHSINTQRHVAIVMISHDLNLIRRYCHKVAVMYAGQVVETGDSQAVFTSPKHPYTKALLSVVPRVDQDPAARLSEIPGYVPETGRDTDECLFRPRCAECTQACSGAVRCLRGADRFVRCSKVCEEAGA